MLELALRCDGPAAAIALGALTVASTAPPGYAGGTACALDGAPRADRLAAALRLDPALAPDQLIAVGYERVGDDLLELIDGSFAFVVWDRERSRGLIARDRLGSRPLFVAPRGSVLLFASEVRNLIGALANRPEPDETALAHWLARAPIADDRTLYAGVRRLPPGHAIRLEDGRWERWRYWAPRYAPPRAVEVDDAAHALRSAIGDAVARSLDGARRPAVLLSGGFDSAAVAAVAGSSVAAAYSGIFPSHPEVDESSEIRGVRDALGPPGVEMDLGEGSALAGAEEYLRAWQLPPASPNGFVWAPLYLRAAADGVDVVLTGDGGDELFGCASCLIGDRLSRARGIAAVRLARRLPGMGARPRPRWLARALLTYGARAALPYRAHERLRWIRGRSRGPAWLADAIEDGRWDWKLRDGPRWWAHLAHVLTADAFGFADERRRAAAMHGLEFREPLRDPQLIEHVLGLPPELAFDPELDRPLARHALKADLPPATLVRTSKPVFNALLEGSLAGPDAARLRDLVLKPHPTLEALTRATEVDRMLSAFAPGSAPPGVALDLWRLATTALWLGL